jgi:hypothetical protein
MEARKQRIGEHAAASHLPWAVTALGPVPADPAARLEWEQRAASVGAYRELSGYAQPGDQAASPDDDMEQTAQQIRELAARHREFADKLAQRQSLEIPAEDPDYENHGPAFPSWTGPQPDAILQPPKPQIQPSQRILERTADRDPDLEAAD